VAQRYRLYPRSLSRGTLLCCLCFVLYHLPLFVLFSLLLIDSISTWHPPPSEDPQNITCCGRAFRRTWVHCCSNCTHPAQAPLPTDVLHCYCFGEMVKRDFWWKVFILLILFLPVALHHYLLPPFPHPVSFITMAVLGIVTPNTITPGASRVPAFYAPTTNSDRYSRMIVFVFIA